MVIAELGSTWYREDATESRVALSDSIQEAVRCGADIVKLQLFRANILYSKERAPKQYTQAKKYELPLGWLEPVSGIVRGYGAKFWCSMFDVGLLKEATPYLDGIKIASGDANNMDLILAAGWTDLPLAISTGACTELEVSHLAGILADRPDTWLMNCVSLYPADVDHYQLGWLTKFREYGLNVGLSDHTLTGELIPVAVALGYTLFEKHFMLDSTPRDNPDFVASVYHKAFEEYVCAIKQTERIIGGNIKPPLSDGEVVERQWIRRGADGLRPNVSTK